MKIKENDSVILYIDEDNIELVKLKSGNIITNKKGIFNHNDIIGKEYGIKIFDTLNRNSIYILRRTPELICISLKKKTQTLYEHDISFICMLCNAIPNKNILEAGTGTGCLTYALANCVLPHGNIYTFEYNDERYKEVKNEFQNFSDIKNNIHFYNEDIINSDIDKLIGPLDSVFLDMPNPWLCVNKIHKILKERGIFVIFLPCIEQVHKTIDELEKYYFKEIATYELLNKSWKIKMNNHLKKNTLESNKNLCNKIIKEKDFVVDYSLPNFRLYQKENKTHTGYLTIAKKALNDEKDQVDVEFNILD